MDTPDPINTSNNAHPSIRNVDAGRGVEWLVGGFRLFAKAPGPWLLAGLALLAGSAILHSIWFGSALATAYGIIFTGAMMRACHALEQGRAFTDGLKEAISSPHLLVLGAIAAGLGFALMLVVGVMGLGAVGVGMFSPRAVGGLIGLGMLVMLVIVIAMGAALWLAPALVVLKGVNPVDAIRLSLTATLRNVGPYLVFALLAMLACLLGALPMGLGLLVVLPVLMCSYYLAYKDLFIGADAGEAVGYTP